MGLDLSIVTGTYNRRALLANMIDSVIEHVHCSYELIIVDGGSNDGTLEMLREIRESVPDLVKVVEQGELLGALKAFNAGFALVEGEFAGNLNDDCELQGPCFDEAIEVLRVDAKGDPDRRRPTIGQVAIPFLGPYHRGAKIDIVGLNYHKWIYANFGVTWTWLGGALKWWGDRYRTYGGDSELSMKIWNSGYSVMPLHTQYPIKHLESNEGVRWPNTDSADFYENWKGWRGPGDTHYPLTLF